MLHVLGMVIGAVALIVGLVTVNPMIALAGAGLGYLLAWTGHFLVTGQLGPELTGGRDLRAARAR